MLQLFNTHVLGPQACCCRVERGRKLDLIEGFEDCIIEFPVDASTVSEVCYQKILS